jgi:hypothetical protein
MSHDDIITPTTQDDFFSPWAKMLSETFNTTQEFPMGAKM